ncbi:MAG TPA: hypothetical protein VFI29_24105 [Hanamia sp.]|nr:hypothetical protein [Hanamia sp.]
MRTLNISISELEYNKFGLKEDELSFSELLDIVSREMARQNLRESVELGKKYGFSKISMKEIDQEIKAVRKHAKASN